jgi:adenine specific DNA methylase Mod
LLNWKLLLAFLRPGFLRSTDLGSRFNKPAAFNTGRNFYYFEDRFADFPTFIKDRLVECKRVLKKDGNIVIHIEPKISHTVRVICDSLDLIFKNYSSLTEFIRDYSQNIVNHSQKVKKHLNIKVDKDENDDEEIITKRKRSKSRSKRRSRKRRSKRKSRR